MGRARIRVEVGVTVSASVTSAPYCARVATIALWPWSSAAWLG